MLPAVWASLTVFAHPLPARFAAGASDPALGGDRPRGRLSLAEWMVLAVFLLTAVAWVFRATKRIGDLTVPGLDRVIPGIDDSTIAVAAAVALFVLPGGRPGARRPVLDWSASKEVPWGVILLFGGGLSLARAMGHSGLDEAIGRAITSGGDLPLLVMVAVVVGATVVLTEFTSNTATASMLMPVLAAAAAAGGEDPLALMMAGAVSCSFAFCLPVATPPNAVVYGSGRLRIGDMIQAGIAMNLIAALGWIAIFFWVAAPLLGFDPATASASPTPAGGP